MAQCKALMGSAVKGLITIAAKMSVQSVTVAETVAD